MKKIYKYIKKWIDCKKYHVDSYGWLDAFIYDPWENVIEIPLQKIWKIIQWASKLWNIMDWEGIHILNVLDYQLSRTQKVLQNDPHHLDEKTNKRSGPIYAKQIQEARNSIAKILENKFCKEEWKQHDKKYGKLKMSRGKISSRDKDGKPLTYSCEFFPDSKASDNLRYKIHTLSERRRKEEFEKLFNNLKDNLDSWWA